MNIWLSKFMKHISIRLYYCFLEIFKCLGYCVPVYRKEVQNLFISKGGEPVKFLPAKYFPHITLGFTKRDLHESDDVKKDRNSCVFDIKVIPRP